MKKVSVIIPCYNSAKYLPQCFLSLVTQTLGIDSIELIFINDASTDDGATWNLLTEMETAYPDSIMIVNLLENQRQGGARNIGLLYASGEYITFVDADDWLEPNALEKAYSTAITHNSDIVAFNFSYYYNDVGIIPHKTSMSDEVLIIETDEQRRQMLIAEKITYGCCAKLYKKSLLDISGVQFPPHMVYEEPLFVYPLLYYGNRYVSLQDHLYIYRQNKLGTSHHTMKSSDTLLQHAEVQLMTWNFMKQTPFFTTFYEEIKLYFLHTYLYETLQFAKNRDIYIPYETYSLLAHIASKEVKDIEQSIYSEMIQIQLQLYRAIKQGLTKESYDSIWNLIPHT